MALITTYIVGSVIVYILALLFVPQDNIQDMAISIVTLTMVWPLAIPLLLIAVPFAITAQLVKWVRK